MPLLKPPEPQVATRKLYLRVEQSLALTAERYAEFLGTDKLDHVVSQALEFIFKRDSQFKQLLAEHPIVRSQTAEMSAKNRPKRSKLQGNLGNEQNEGGQP